MCLLDYVLPRTAHIVQLLWIGTTQVEHSTGLHNHQQNVEKFLKRESRVKLKTALTAIDDPVAEVSKSEDDMLYLMAILSLGCSQYSGQN
jgi:hypothetical protein